MIKKRKEESGLVEKYINGNVTEEEYYEVEALFANGEHNAFLKHLLENDWNGETFEESSNKERLSVLLDRVHHQIRKTEYREGRKAVKRLAAFYMKAAAVIVLPLMLLTSMYMVYHGRSTNKIIASSTIIAPMGSRVSFTLPDSTTGMLNSGSALTYTTPFDRRNVTLNGEAWFDVKHDKKNPFTIEAGGSKIKVLGTSFNVSAYPAEEYIEVVLKEGIVSFTPTDNTDEIVLLPSERIVCRNGSVTKSKDDIDKYISWTEGKLVFRSDPMGEVARRLERWYNVRITIEDKELEKYSFRATFEDDSIEDVLQFLSMTSPITYEIQPRLLQADGTYGKTNIIIRAKK